MINQGYLLTAGHFCLGEGKAKLWKQKKHTGQVLQDNKQQNIWVNTFLSLEDGQPWKVEGPGDDVNIWKYTLEENWIGRKSQTIRFPAH